MWAQLVEVDDRKMVRPFAEKERRVTRETLPAHGQGMRLFLAPAHAHGEAQVLQRGQAASGLPGGRTQLHAVEVLFAFGRGHPVTRHEEAPQTMQQGQVVGEVRIHAPLDRLDGMVEPRLALGDRGSTGLEVRHGHRAKREQQHGVNRPPPPDMPCGSRRCDAHDDVALAARALEVNVMHIEYNKPCANCSRRPVQPQFTLNPNRGLNGQYTASSRPTIAVCGRSPNFRLS